MHRTELDIDDLRASFCFGVAGNFAGHLEQAGEAPDFANVRTASAELPKGIFPWYAPGADTFVGEFPISDSHLVVPPAPDGQPQRIQIEPELAALCDVVRDDRGRVERLVPRLVAAFDDCSVRRPGARKISHKKNWGDGSKGLAATAFEIDDELDPSGACATLRLASFLRRGPETHAYGTDSAVSTYTLFGAPLLDWLVDRLHHQRGSDDTPLEDVGELLDASESSTVLVGVGATRYEPYGETTFVELGDEAIVVLYDSAVHAPEDVARLVGEHRDGELRGASVLHRVAVAAPDR